MNEIYDHAIKSLKTDQKTDCIIISRWVPRSPLTDNSLNETSNIVVFIHEIIIDIDVNWYGYLWNQNNERKRRITKHAQCF